MLSILIHIYLLPSFFNNSGHLWQLFIVHLKILLFTFKFLCIVATYSTIIHTTINTYLPRLHSAKFFFQYSVLCNGNAPTAAHVKGSSARKRSRMVQLYIQQITLLIELAFRFVTFINGHRLTSCTIRCAIGQWRHSSVLVGMATREGWRCITRAYITSWRVCGAIVRQVARRSRCT